MILERHGIEVPSRLVTMRLWLPLRADLGLARGTQHLAAHVIAQRRPLELTLDWIDEERALGPPERLAEVEG